MGIDPPSLLKLDTLSESITQNSDKLDFIKWHISWRQKGSTLYALTLLEAIVGVRKLFLMENKQQITDGVQ